MEMLSGTGSGVTLGNKSLWEERRLVSVARSGTIFWDAWTVEPNKQGIWRLIDGQSFEKQTALRMTCCGGCGQLKGRIEAGPFLPRVGA